MKYISRKLNRCSHGKDNRKTCETYLFGNEYFGSQQNVDVQISLRLHQNKIRKQRYCYSRTRTVCAMKLKQKISTKISREMWKSGSIRVTTTKVIHLALQNEKQNGCGNDERRMWWKTDLGIFWVTNAYKMVIGKEEKKCKGVKKNVVKSEIPFEDYKECLFSGNSTCRKMNTFRSRKHDIYTERINKTALSANDEKRIICENGIHTIAIGHGGAE